MIAARADSLLRKIHSKPLALRLVVFCSGAIGLATLVQGLTRGF